MLDSVGSVSGTTETVERYLAQKVYASQVYSHRLVVAVWANKTLACRATKEVMFRALLSELEFDSAQLVKKDVVTTLRAVQGEDSLRLLPGYLEHMEGSNKTLACVTTVAPWARHRRSGKGVR